MPAPKGRRAIRVAFCLDSLDTGGTELNAVRTAEHFDPSRVEVEFFVLAARGVLLDRVRAGGFPIHGVPVFGVASPRTVISTVRFAARLRRDRFDVLHAHDIYTNMMVVPWARLVGVPLVVASRRWWTETNHPLHARLNRFAYSCAHRVLANSDSVGRLVVEEGVPARRVVVVPNFVDAAAFLPPAPAVVDAMRAEFGIARADVVVGIVANLHAIKDHATLLRALARLVPTFGNLRLVIVGDGVERKALEQLAADLGIVPHVVFAGKRPHHPSPHWLFALSLLTSRGEGFPNSVVEAMAAGRPLVATAVGGVPDVVEEGVTGFLVPPGDPERLANAIEHLLTNPVKAKEMGEAGRRRAREKFFADNVVRRLEDWYEAALGRGQESPAG